MPPSMGDEEPPPPPYVPEPETGPGCKAGVGNHRANWTAAPRDWELTDDTSAAAIAADQRAVIAEAIPRVGRDVARLSEECILAVDVIKRRLEEMSA